MSWLEQMFGFEGAADWVNNYKFIVTVLIILASLFLKHLIIDQINKRFHENKRPRINMVNNVFTLSVIVVLFNLWSEEMQKVAFSIAAFIVAIVLATREFIQCIIGFIYILSSRPFRIGD